MINRALLVFLGFGLLAPALLMSQTVVSLGAFVGGGNVIPFKLKGAGAPQTWGESSRYQVAYGASEIGLVGGGKLSKVRIAIVSGTPCSYDNFRLRCAHTTLSPSSLTFNFGSNFSGVLQTCLGDSATASPFNPVNYTPAIVNVGGVSFAEFSLTTTFTYNGTQNLLLDFSFDAMSGNGFDLDGAGGRSRAFAIKSGTNSFAVSSAGYLDSGGNWRVQLEFDTGAVLNVSAVAGTQQQLFANATGSGGNGVPVGQFSITNSSSTLSGTLTSIQVQGDGTGNHLSAYTDLRVVRETGAVAGFDATDQILSGGTFAGAPSLATFPVTGSEQNFSASQHKNYYLVARLNGSAAPSQTFTFTIASLTLGASTSATGVPSVSMSGFSILAPEFAFTDGSPTTAATAYPGSVDNLIQKFGIVYTGGPNNTLAGISVQATGSGNDQNDYASVKLYRDSNGSGVYDLSDALVDTRAAFPADDGSMNFTLSGAESQFAAGDSRTYFIIVAFNTNGANNTHFATQLRGASGASTGTVISGLPAPAAATAGLDLFANGLNATLNGPGTATGVDSNEQGPGGNGVVICDVSLATANASWTVSALVFRSNGGGDDSTAFNYLALFEDSNGSGSFDGADAMSVTAAGTAFASNDGDYSATLINGAFPATTTRRFFLVAKWGGTATSGQTFQARLRSVVGSSPSGGLVTGAPTADASSFTVNAAVLSVSNAPGAPVSQIRQGGAAFSHELGLFRFAASNSDFTVNSINLTTTGSGNWAADLSASGLDLYVDNGNGTFDIGIDALVFSGAGAFGSVTCTLTSPLNVGAGTHKDIWLRLGIVNTAGASVPTTFIVAIASPADINASGGSVAFGTPAPSSSTLGVAIFFVSSFAPGYDAQAGGAAITITGSGFIAPITLTIGGSVCAGTPVIAAGGTQITGLLVPPGTGSNQPIVLTDGALGAQTLNQTFSYAGGSVFGSGPGSKGGGACEANENGTAWLAGILFMTCALSIRFRGARSR